MNLRKWKERFKEFSAIATGIVFIFTCLWGPAYLVRTVLDHGTNIMDLRQEADSHEDSVQKLNVGVAQLKIEVSDLKTEVSELKSYINTNILALKSENKDK